MLSSHVCFVAQLSFYCCQTFLTVFSGVLMSKSSPKYRKALLLPLKCDLAVMTMMMTTMTMIIIIIVVIVVMLILLTLIKSFDYVNVARLINSSQFNRWQ